MKKRKAEEPQDYWYVSHETKAPFKRAAKLKVERPRAKRRSK